MASVIVRALYYGGHELTLPIEAETGWDDLPIFSYAPDKAYGEDGKRLHNAFTAAELGLHDELFHNLFQSYEIYNTLCAKGEKYSAIEAHYMELKGIVLEAAIKALKARNVATERALRAAKETEEAFAVEQWATAFRLLERAEEAAEAGASLEAWVEETEASHWDAQYLREEAAEACLHAEMAEMAMDYWEHSRTWYD